MYRIVCLLFTWLCGAAAYGEADENVFTLLDHGRPKCALITSDADELAARLAVGTVNGCLTRFFGGLLPTVGAAVDWESFLVTGRPAGNTVLARLVAAGTRLRTEEIGDEGFHLLSVEREGRRYLVVHGLTPRAVKHGLQELLFYRTRADGAKVTVDWPLDVVMKPAFAYRGVYILPCWSAHDSFESWQRVLRFHSELTINRNWFWLDGFPLAGHRGEYAGTDLAEPANVQQLIDLCVAEDMKFLIGGGWLTWHHQKAVGRDPVRGVQYYLDYWRAFKRFHGLYLEPTGEGGESGDWRTEVEGLRQLIESVLKKWPDAEIAVAIGRFNNPEYLRLMSGFDPRRVYWWWCWGDPIGDGATALYPAVLRWHIISRMADYHGSILPPEPRESALAGVVTSYDPGQGFGNPWEGWGKLGTDRPRNFDPYDIPFFGHQYFYRERCWNLHLGEADFVQRLSRRLFDADAPAEAGPAYWALTRLVLAANEKSVVCADELDRIRKLVTSMLSRRWTPRMNDTLARMEKAVTRLDEWMRRAPDAGESNP